MKHYGDITKINGAAVEAVDVICGGSPCQDLSIAGKRAGLAGERSGLFMDQIRIIKEMRKNELELCCGRTNDAVRCRFMVWENVPGAFSSNNGEDFRAVLEETCRVVDENACVPSLDNGKWPHAGVIMGSVDGSDYSVAWRLHDAQFWGVAQRRKRIALVADFGGTAAAEILFECESMSGNLEQGEQARQGTADDAEGRIGTSSAISFQERAGKPGGGKGILIQNERTGALSTLNHQYTCTECYSIDEKMGNTYVHEDMGNTLGARDYKQPQAVCIQGNAIDRQPQNGPNGKGVIEDVSFTLNTIDRHAVAYGLDRASYNQGANAQFGFSIEQDKIGTMSAMGPGAVCAAVDCRNATESEEISNALQSSAEHNINSNNVCRQNSVVRRLTPKECERLQNFPDNWTLIPDWIDSKGKLHKGESDSPRYKALGSSIALPFWQWLAERIAKHLPQGATMASLFDGIGGFPLVFSRAGVRPVWASEIEEFPIAVTKYHFPEKEEKNNADSN